MKSSLFLGQELKREAISILLAANIPVLNLLLNAPSIKTNFVVILSSQAYHYLASLESLTQVTFAERREEIMEISVGQKARRSMTFSSEHVRQFAEMTGDYNPLHFERSFAEKTKFKRLVVQGGLTTGLLHALVAMDMPGPGTVFLSQNWRFTAPVFIGDTITAEAEVLKVHASKPVTQLKINITQQDGEEVLEGEAWCYTFSGKDD